jgi:hypothetical protein
VRANSAAGSASFAELDGALGRQLDKVCSR